VYLDTTYIAKFYFNEPGSPRVRELVRKAGTIHSSLWTLAEFHSLLHRQVREGAASPDDAQDLDLRFSEHVADGLWNLVPVHETLLRRTGSLMISAPRDLFIRTAAAVHLETAHEIGEREVWTNDRHMLAAATYFGLTARSVRI
jgi:predicted nucleic acid-binding protein